MDVLLLEACAQWREGLITDLEFRNKFVLRLVDVEDSTALGWLANAYAEKALSEGEKV